jgi:GntR family transcriptional regulator, trigonelline degradation regulator
VWPREASCRLVVQYDHHIKEAVLRSERERGVSTRLPTSTIPFSIARSAAPVRTQVEQYIRQAILSGQFRPGARLIERELRGLLGVSRTSLREALRQLEERGLVQNVPQKGLVVATVTPEEADEISQVRGALAGLAGRLFTERANRNQRVALQEALYAFEGALQSGDLPAVITAKDHFSTVILEGAGNHTMKSILIPLEDRIALLRYRALAQSGCATQSLEEMRLILAAVLAGDSDGAAQGCVEHAQAWAAWTTFQTFQPQEAASGAESLSMRGVTSS